MVTVFGRLLASFFDAQASPVPVTGRVLFTPNFSSEHTVEGVHLPTRLSVELDSGGSFEARLLTGGWSWRVEVIAKDQTGRTLTVPCFNFLPTPGVDRVNFADIVPLTDPVTGQPMLRGDDGIGVEAITTAGGELIFTLTNGSEARIPVPQGVPGPGVEGITLEGDELVFTLSDGSETRLPAPAGAPGKDAPKPNLAVGEVQTLPAGASATAEVTGMSPDFVLSLGVPAGANGKTPTITAGTVSTLPAGASATADMVPTTDGYVLNLGLPAGAPGAPGKDAPTPTLSVGTVSTGTAAASITGTAPNFVLNLTLPAGGGSGSSSSALIGAGRPDTPATLSTANQSAVSSAQVGATFTSTDGAGTGAWVWVKTPTGWEPTYADTGWRDITSLATLPTNVSWATTAPVFAGVFVRRQGGLLTVVIRGLTTTAKTSLTILSLPTGFRASKNATDMTSVPTLHDNGESFTGKITFWDGVHLQAKTVAAARLDTQFTLPARDPWPATLPGAPANLV